MQFTSEECLPRTRSVYERHCLSLNGPAQDAITTTYGINGDSVLNKLQYFHVTFGLPPDVMHDIFEGAAVVEFKCMLSVFVQKKNFFTSSTINN